MSSKCPFPPTPPLLLLQHTHILTHTHLQLPTYSLLRALRLNSEPGPSPITYKAFFKDLQRMIPKEDSTVEVGYGGGEGFPDDCAVFTAKEHKNARNDVDLMDALAEAGVWE